MFRLTRRQTAIFQMAVFFFVFSQIFIANNSYAKMPESRPRIWVKPSDKPAILNKIETQPWAQSLFQQMQQRLDFVVNAKQRGEVLISSLDN